MRNDIKRFFVVVLAACGLAVSAANVAAVPLTLIPESGDARCAIVVDPAVMASGSSTTGLVNPALEAEKQRIRLRDSVQDLAAVLKKMTGREVPVVTGPAPAGKTPIFIGSSARAVFGPVGVSAPFQQGMRVVVDAGKGVGLYGESMLADSYAVYTFLDQLGCRWFMPGELGEIIPQKAELVVEEVDLQDAPYTVYRGGSGYGFDDVFMRRNRMGGVLPPTQHCLESGYISRQEKALHPEWIAEYADGTPMPNRLKWSNAELANRIGEIIAERQRTSPQFFYCLSPDDGAVFDQSEEDKALDAGDFDPTFQMISITDRAVTFYNRIVERAVSEHPDLLFSALAYVQYTRPPLRERPHTNLVIQLAPITYSRAHPMNMDEVPDNTALRYIISGWGDASQAMSYYFYAYYLADPVSSAPFLRKWAVDIPYIYKHGSCRYWQPETMGNNEFFFMAQWMAQRMAWNPEQDPWALYREANDAMYGPAAETMWAFWNAVDKCWVETPEYSGAGWGHINRFTPERVAEISALIAQAANEAGTGPARERVRLAETSWKLTSDFTQLRRDLAEGRWTDLDTRSQAWKKTVSQAAIASGDHRCYAWCWFGADKTFGGQYYDWFYSRTHASAQNIATNATLLVAKPVRDFRWKAVERGAPDTEGFSTPGFNDSAWPTTDVALQTWSSLGLHNHMGSMWYRTTIDVAQPQSGKTVWLWVGSTDGSVKAFVNGQAVQGGVVPRTGETFKPVDEPSSYGAPMRFDVTSVIRPGANSIALFATRGAGPNEIGTGGLLSPVVVYGEYMNTAGGTTNVNFTALTQSVGEGGGKVTVTLQLSEVAAEDVTVPLVLSGTAVAGSDFLSFPTTVVIPAGSTTATFDIALVDDALFEVAETLILTMGAPTHAIAGSASKLTITITDNDGANKPAVRFTSESQSVAAGSTATLGVSLTKASGADTTIGLSFEGTATNNLDYTVDKTSVTIPAGETEATVSFKLLKRAAGKTVIASIKDSSNADMGAPRIHTLTIAASEAPPPALPAGVYLKALGVNEERTTVDGTSWATAYTDAQTALTAALASEDGTLYVAAGVYPLSSTTAVGDKRLKIYGGFAGIDGETLEDRDTENNQSIFTGDKNGNDCYIHYELSTNAPSPSVTITTTDCPMVKDGRFNPPPAYSGEYDIYATAINNGTGASLTGDNWWSGLFTFSNGATFALDGIYLIGYRNQLFGASGANTSVTINDCRFYANRGASGVFSVDSLKSFTLSNSHFAYGVADACGGIWCASPGLVTNCLFESVYSTATLRGGIIHLSNGKYPTVIADSIFRRICRHGRSELAHGGPAVCINAENGGTQPLIRGCQFTYCWNLMTESATGCSPIVGTSGGSWYIEDSRFEHNFISCSVKSGYSYFLVGQHEKAGRQGGAYFRNTVFADNVIAAHADEGKGNYALGIAGSDSYTGNNYGNASKHVFVNCLFDRNFAEDRTGRSDVAPVLSEGLLASANTFGTVCGAANCTFISAKSANPSVALFGSKHYWPVNVVNCLFLSDAAIANPFYSRVVPTDTIGLRAYSCTAQNCFTVPQNVVAEGWQTDWVPLVVDKEEGPFPVVKVLTPGLRETADLAVTDYYVKDKNVQYRFKPYGSDAWQTLHLHSSAVVTTEPDVLVADAVGVARPKGAVTRGCVQSLTADGELGKAVILRREPFGGGDLGGAPAAQNVGALEQSVVRAAPIEGASFQGWYNAAGSLVEGNPTIDLSSFADGAILTAKFGTKEVTVTFDLGQGGQFSVENNPSIISYTMREGDVFPKLPPYVESDEWLVEGWDESPAFVPSENLTIKAKLLTKASRVFCIVPLGEVPEGSDGTGTNWVNATADIAAAARDAARYRGELWFKEGTYKLSAPIGLYPNVAFIGGFNGTETERNQADPSAHVTLLTGDPKAGAGVLNGENYWKPQGSDPGAGNRTPVFDYATRTLNVPQSAPDVQTPVWRVQYTSNAATAFSDSVTSCATNALISGMTIACFSGSAINVTYLKSQTLVENCRFVGNSWNANNAGVVCVKGSLQMRHCDFRYNQGGVDFKDANDNRLSVVDDCTFYCNEICKSRVFRYWSNLVPLTSSNCCFENNVYTAGDTSTCSIEFSGRGCTISNWVVRNTRNCPLPNANASAANGHISLSGNHTFVRCRFEDNRLDYSTLSSGLSGQSAVFYQNGGNVLCRDCFFARNTVKSLKATTERTVVTSVAALHSGSMAFINCTLMDNSADAMESTTAAAATVGDRNEHKECGLAFVHCTLANNTAQGGIAAADLLMHPDSEKKNTTRHGIGILNSILHNSKDPSYKPLRLLASKPATIRYSALSNINKEEFNTTADGAFWEDVTDNTSGIAARTSVSPDGVKALGINSTSPLTHGTGTIVISNNRPYLWNAENAEGVDWKTYISLVEPNFTRTPAQVGLPSTDKSQPAPLPDAFGAPRTIGKLAAGALKAAGGLMILVF